MLQDVRDYAPDIPIGLLVYSNLIFSKGIERFYQQISEIGVDSVLIADVPIKESTRFADCARRFSVDPVFICPPDASDELLQQVAQQSTGYVYLLSRAGVTGAETHMQVPADKLIAKLADLGAPPLLLGFGISQPEHVSSALQAGAHGAISGSAVVAIIEKNLDNGAQQVAELRALVKRMKSATTLS